MCGTEVEDILEFVEILTEVNTFLSVYFFVVASTDKYCCTYFTIQIVFWCLPFFYCWTKPIKKSVYLHLKSDTVT